jgi:hypothetical protein
MCRKSTTCRQCQPCWLSHAFPPLMVMRPGYATCSPTDFAADIRGCDDCAWRYGLQFQRYVSCLFTVRCRTVGILSMSSGMNGASAD